MNFHHVHMVESLYAMSDSEEDSVATTMVTDDEEDPDRGILYENECPHLQQTPPQPDTIRVCLPGLCRSSRKRPRSPSVMDVSTPLDMVVDRWIPMDVWCCNILPFVDLSGLLQLSFTCHGIRTWLNRPDTIEGYLQSAWFTRDRDCSCQRNLHRLSIPDVLDFYHDCTGIHSARDAEVFLRAVGRGVEMYEDPRRTRPIRPVIRRDQHPGRFTSGLLAIHLDGLLVPIPRMTHVPVEASRGTSVGYRNWSPTRREDETNESYSHRMYWRAVHDLDDTDKRHGREDGFDLPPYPRDPVVHYVKEICPTLGLNPQDANEDDEEQSGYRAAEYARTMNHRSPVGVQTYPFDLCIHRSELRGVAHRRGIGYLEMLFVPADRGQTQRDDTPSQMLMHNGVVYLHPIRYNNEGGDFVPWCLSTMAVLRSVQLYAWYDAILYVIRRMNEVALMLATEVQNDMSFAQMVLRWEFLQRTQVRMEAVWPPKDYPTPRNPNATTTTADTENSLYIQYTDELIRMQEQRNQRAGCLLRCTLFAHHNRHIQSRIADYESGQAPSYDSFRSGYLASMLPMLYDQPPTPHTEMGLIRRLHQMMWLLDYVTEFASSIGPRVDALTDRRRGQTRTAFLGMCTSLLLYAPGFSDRYHWCPRRAGEDAGSRIPRIDLTHNHRYQMYRHFLTNREMYRSSPYLL